MQLSLDRIGTTIIACLLLVFAMLGPTSAALAQADPAISVRHASYIDETRPIRASNGFAGSATRRIDVTVWSPANVANASAVRRPLIIYSHGAYGRADDAMHLVNALVEAGFVVAAPDYPLSSRAAYTLITGADTTDVGNQVRDVRFVIDRLLADQSLAIDSDRIAAIGHSLGAVTTYFASHGSGINDLRIKAAVMLGGGDPVQAALAANMGLIGTWTLPVPVPTLALSAEHDAFALITGRPYVAYTRIAGPKYELMVHGGVHVWFTDYARSGPNGSNPDCVMLGGGRGMAGCDTGAALTTPARQQEVTRTTVLDFLAGYLGNDRAAITRLRALPATMSDVTLRYED